MCDNLSHKDYIFLKGYSQVFREQYKSIPASGKTNFTHVHQEKKKKKKQGNLFKYFKSLLRSILFS